DRAPRRGRGHAWRRDLLVRASRRRRFPGADLQACTLLPDAVSRRPLRRPRRRAGCGALVLSPGSGGQHSLRHRAPARAPGARAPRAGKRARSMELAAGLRVVLAPNPGLMTGPGTNQYLLGEHDALQLDAAPLDDENRRRLAASGVEAVALVL